MVCSSYWQEERSILSSINASISPSITVRIHRARSCGMSRMPADESVDNAEARFSYEKFARHHFFKQANAWLVAHSGICSNSSVVDLACGPGAVTELILRELDETVPGTCVYAVDPSPSALALARKRVHSPIVRFIQGSAERLASLVPQVDVVVFTNAIHLVADKVTAFEQVFKTLRRGGVLGFNTTFFDGAYPDETRRFYKLWVLRAVGFAEPLVELQEKALSRESLEDIGQFSLFIEGALPGVPLDVGAEALTHGVRQGFEGVKGAP